MQRIESTPNPEPMGSPWPFRFLMLFTFVLFLAPQETLRFLIPLHLAKIFAGLALATYLLDRLGSGRPLTVMGTEVKLVLAMFVVAALSIPFSLWPGGSAGLLTDQLLKSVLIFILVANTVITLRRLRTFLVGLTCFGVVLAVKGILAFARGEFLATGVPRIAGYDAPLTGNPNDLALTLNLILGLTIGLAFAARSQISRAVLLGTVTLLAIGTVITFSRAGFLGLVTLFILVAKRFVIRKPLASLVALAVIGGLIFLSPQGYLDRIYSIADPSKDPTGSATARWDLMKSSLELVQENPIVGVGLGMSGLALTEKGHWWTEVHNVYLQVAVDIGVGGLLVYLLLIRSLVRRSRRTIWKLSAVARDRRAVSYARGFQIALYTFLVEAFFHPVAYHFYFFYVAGIGVALQRLTAAGSGMRRDEKSRKAIGSPIGASPDATV